jgi:hypothetical protein
MGGGKGGRSQGVGAGSPGGEHRTDQADATWSLREVRTGHPPQALFVLLIPRKEVIQPQVPLRLPCYDLVPIRESIFGTPECDFGCPPLSWLDGRCVQGSGTHSPRCC